MIKTIKIKNIKLLSFFKMIILFFLCTVNDKFWSLFFKKNKLFISFLFKNLHNY